MIEVELPDGTIAEFPDGTSNDVIKGVLQKQFGGGQGATPQTAAPAAVPSWAENIDAFGRGVANGASFGFADNVGAGARWLGGKVLPWQENVTYDQALQEVKNEDRAVAEANPMADISGNVLGALATASRLPTVAGSMGTSAMTGATGLGARALLAGGEGAGYGALTSLGNDQDVGTGALIGGGLGVAGSLAGDAIQGVVNARTQARAVPTIDDLKSEANTLYKTAEARGVVADAAATQNLSDSVRKIARDNELITPKGRISEAYPRAKEAMTLLDDYAGEVMNPTQMQVVRDTLADARNATEGKERRIASKMLEEFDKFTTPLAPELDEARKVSQRYIKAGQLERMRELGDIRAGQFTNSGTENAMRTEYRQLDRAIAKGQEAGWGPAEREAIANVSRGTPGQTLARNVGKLAPTGPVSFMAGAGVPFMVGNAIGGPGTGAASAAVASSLGYGGKAVANSIQARNIQIAELLARSGGQLPQVNDSGIRDAVVRALIAGGTNQLAGQ
jgi:hypothetical protein